MHRTAVVVCAALLATRSLQAQACKKDDTYFEFQVSVTAAFIADSSALKPDPQPTRNPPNLVQFNVDTTGAVEIASFHALKFYGREFVDSVRAVLPKWRFKPALLNGHKVCQLFQTPVVLSGK